MTALIHITQQPAKRFAKLARHLVIEEIEDIGMDPGRFFVHLIDGYSFNDDPLDKQPQTLKSFGSVAEARKGLKKVTKCKYVKG